MPITRAEAQQGAEIHPQLLAEFGGAMTGPQAAYVALIGKNIAVHSELGNGRDSFKVSLLKSSANNAFAIPSGYIYSTRQPVSLMNNEAALAAVPGHEVAHVPARHSQRRQQRAQENSLLGGLGAILSGVFLGNSGIGSVLSRLSLQGSQLLTLKFSRSQELWPVCPHATPMRPRRGSGRVMTGRSTGMFSASQIARSGLGLR